MVPIIVLLTIVVFIAVDLALRIGLKRFEAAKLARERRAALDAGLKLDYTDEARSLKRVEIESPRARILAVDDEPVVLDSFRKILVLAGFSIDTVETGQEALGLIRKRDYDFVFTDLKMPGLDGVDVTKAVKHLRPDIDVVVITGYATIESAVETMKYGAMDYVQKPFTEDELVEFSAKLLHRRQDRLERATPPRIHLVTPSSGESDSQRVINVPGGVFVSAEHTWVGVDISGEARLGLDDFAHKTLGAIEEIELPEEGATVRRGDPLFSIRRGERRLAFQSPVSGKVTRVNQELVYHLDLLRRRPFELGWICCLEPAELSRDIEELAIGADAVPWYEKEVRRFREAVSRLARERGESTAGKGSAEGAGEDLAASVDDSWRTFAELFLQRREAEVVT